MNQKWEIDSALRLVGSAQPPVGLERRVIGRLEQKMRVERGGRVTIHLISAAAIAASVVFGAAALAPSVRELALRSGSMTVTAPARVPSTSGSFGAASAVHLPAAPLPVKPTPVNQGRGRARSDRELGPEITRLPHGVAVPRHIAISQSPHAAFRTVPVSSTHGVAVSAHP